ncbi:hypothetical protein BT63DRAFT_421538 [Microthyrium microscopicum]|uniref:DUF7779 domain-containing protein n=1 Tax=Microthyrium microscopicum TaxID=703497 RepID=A0A6A6UPI6_9PEZI|nr:hypothetical protein BT63DRAFT_421538 [Microthyrium microscopicum]
MAGLASYFNIHAKLCPVHKTAATYLDFHATTVIVVPDVGTQSSVSSWKDGSDCWLNTVLPNLVNKPLVLEYQYASNSGSNFSWEQLARCGDNLLELIISTAKDDPKFLRRPLVFICHGIGGVVAKRVCQSVDIGLKANIYQTIGTLHAEYYKLNYDKVISILSGIVFLGCPHLTYEQPQTWFKISALLRAATDLSKDNINKAAGQVSVIARICQTFKESRTPVPILSAVEGKTTKIETKMMVSRKELLVDEQFGRTGLPKEQVTKVDSDHHNLCSLSSTSAFTEKLGAFFAIVEKNSTILSASGDEQASLQEWTITASENDLVHRTVSPGNTGDATLGVQSDASYEIIPLNSDLTGDEKMFNLPLYLMKPHNRNQDFFGRQDTLELLAEKLIPQKSQTETLAGIKTFALCGAGGLGKTQIAVEFAFQAQKQFDAVFFLQASEVGKLAQSYTEISGSLGLEEEATDQVVSKDLVLEWLSSPVRQIQEGSKNPDDPTLPAPTWLIVFDNADDLSVLRDFWPVSGNGSILVTSRDPLAKTRSHVSVAGGIDLDPFGSNEAGTLLRQLTGYHENSDVEPSEAIAAKLSGLPLAITQIAGTIQRRDLDFVEFLDLYERETVRSDFYKDGVMSVQKNLYTVWAFEDLSPQALALLYVISFLDPDQIPEELLLNMANVEEIDRIKDYPQDTAEFVAARTELTKSSLLKRNRERKELIIHRIVQDTSRARMDVDTFKAVFNGVQSLLYITWPFSMFDHSVERLKKCEPTVPHVASMLRIYGESDMLKTLDHVVYNIARLSMDFGRYYFERGNIPDSIPYFQAAEKICERDAKSTYVTNAQNEGCLAQIATIMNQPDTAIVHAEKSLQLFVDNEEFSWRRAQAYNELGEAYIGAGRFEDAIEQHEAAIKCYYEHSDHYPDWGYLNKGMCLCSLGRYQEASDVLEPYLEYREKTFGPMDTESFKPGLGLLLLGKVRGCQRRIDESLDLYLKALAQYCTTLGTQHYRVAALYYKIGLAYMELEQTSDACLMFQKGLEIYGEKKDYAAQIAQSLLKLSNAQGQLGFDTEASRSLKKAKAYLEWLTKKHGRKIGPDDLVTFIPNWAQ